MTVWKVAGRWRVLKWTPDLEDTVAFLFDLDVNYIKDRFVLNVRSWNWGYITRVLEFDAPLFMTR